MCINAPGMWRMLALGVNHLRFRAHLLLRGIMDRGEAKPVKLMDCMLPRKDRLRGIWSAFVSGVLEGRT